MTDIGRKLPLNWLSTPTEDLINLTAVEKEPNIFDGNALAAAERFHEIANVAATIAVAEFGLDETTGTLIADPSVKGNTHQFEANGAFGEMSIRIGGNPLPDSPKSSALTALSAIRAIRNRTRHVRI